MNWEIPQLQASTDTIPWPNLILPRELGWHRPKNSVSWPKSLFLNRIEPEPARNYSLMTKTVPRQSWDWTLTKILSIGKFIFPDKIRFAPTENIFLKAQKRNRITTWPTAQSLAASSPIFSAVWLNNLVIGWCRALRTVGFSEWRDEIFGNQTVPSKICGSQTVSQWQDCLLARVQPQIIYKRQCSIKLINYGVVNFPNRSNICRIESSLLFPNH